KKRMAKDNRRYGVCCSWFFIPRANSLSNTRTRRRQTGSATRPERLPTKEHAPCNGNARSSFTLPEHRLSYAPLVGRSKRKGGCCAPCGYADGNTKSDGRKECPHHG